MPHSKAPFALSPRSSGCDIIEEDSQFLISLVGTAFGHDTQTLRAACVQSGEVVSQSNRHRGGRGKRRLIMRSARVWAAESWRMARHESYLRCRKSCNRKQRVARSRRRTHLAGLTECHDYVWPIGATMGMYAPGSGKVTQARVTVEDVETARRSWPLWSSSKPGNGTPAEFSSAGARTGQKDWQTTKVIHQREFASAIARAEPPI
jgi:hypothetical protein